MEGRAARGRGARRLDGRQLHVLVPDAGRRPARVGRGARGGGRRRRRTSIAASRPSGSASGSTPSTACRPPRRDDPRGLRQARLAVAGDAAQRRAAARRRSAASATTAASWARSSRPSRPGSGRLRGWHAHPRRDARRAGADRGRQGGRRGRADRRRAAGDVRARAVVSACGALHTPVLLARSGINSSALGKHLRLHPVLVIWGQFDEAVRPWEGMLASTYSDQDQDMDGRRLRREVRARGHPAEHPALVLAVARRAPARRADAGPALHRRVGRAAARPRRGGGAHRARRRADRPLQADVGTTSTTCAGACAAPLG